MPLQENLVSGWNRCMWPPLPRPSGGLAEHLGGHGIERHALGNGEVMRAVRADHGIFRAQVRAYAHGHRLLPGREMHLARHRAGADIEGRPFWILGGSLPSV